MLNQADLQREAATSGFRPEALEKVIRLFELLEGLRSHPFLKTRIAQEVEFLDRLNERGEIVPELLADDQDLQATIRSHPGLLWKALNVRKHGVQRH